MRWGIMDLRTGGGEAKGHRGYILYYVNWTFRSEGKEKVVNIK